MHPKSLHVPAILTHKRSGRQFVVARQPDGSRRQVYLRGEPDSAEQKKHYKEVLANVLAGKPVVPPKPEQGPSNWPTVGQLAAAFVLWAGRYYVDANGRTTGEVVSATYAFEVLLDLHRDTPTDRITIGDLLNVRQAMIDGRAVHEKGRQAPNGLCRRTINDRVHRIKRLFRWGVEQKLVPGSTWHELSALRGVPKGRGGVHDNKPVEAVPRSMVDAILPLLPSPLAAAVELQWWSGMRPAEVLSIRTCDIDRKSKVWTYRPEQHKGLWRGKERIVQLGPKAQEFLRPLLKADPKAFLISPRDALAEQKAEKRANRKSPMTPSQRARDARNAKKPPAVGDRYDVDAYRTAIHRACDLADPQVPHWSPHRLRHAAGTRIYLQAGLEEARVALGHADDSITRHYAVAADSQLAADVMGRLG